MTGPRWFYDLLLREYPALDNPTYARLFLYLLSPTRVGDDGEGPTLLGGDILAGCMGRSPEYVMGNLKGAESTRVFLARFKQDVLPGLEYTKPQEGRQREVAELGIKQTVLAAWETVKGLRAHTVRDRVWLDTGEAYNRVTLCRERKRVDEEMEGQGRVATTDVGSKLYGLLERIHPRNFSDVLYHLDAAYGIAEGYESVAKREQVREQLSRIAADPIQRYRFSEYTARLNPMGVGLATVPSEIRRVLLPNAEEYDLSSAQLAIVATEWGVEPLRAFLAEGHSIWPELWAWMGLDSDAKKAIKKGVYALTYGAGETRIRKELLEVYAAETGREMPAAAIKRFLSHPFIEAVQAAKEVQVQRIIQDGGTWDCFGRWLSDGNHKFYEGPERSILAQVNQSRELWLMEPLIDLAIEEERKARPEWRIVLWQHDGVSITFSRRRAQHEAQIIAAVAAYADKHGYPTGLEVG